MKAVVLAGGEGARLAPYTRILPKPLLPVGDQPILEIIVDQLRDSGIDEIVLATGYLSSLIETYFGDGSAFGIPISYVRENRPLGTAGALAAVGTLDSPFLVMNGDILTEPFYADLCAAHQASEATATIATRQEELTLDYGIVRMDDRPGAVARVLRIDEKPRYVVDVSLGVSVFEPSVLDYIEADRRLDFPDLIGVLTGAGELVQSFRHSGYWLDVGTVHRLESGLKDFEEGAERWIKRVKSDPRRRGADDRETRP
ncbi:MAG: NDP-mannose synthase [Thermoleophilaceae bacterium]|nr:NDP-mannose synthase [Thermoleophilaceae bacterium]